MSMKSLVHRVLSPLLYRERSPVLPSRVPPLLVERRFILAFLDRLGVDCVLDVGANTGQYARELRLIGFKGTIISFEPTPEPLAKLRQASARDSCWHVCDYALGAETGFMAMNLMNRSDFNSLRAPSTSESAHYASENRVVDQIQVRVERLDEVFPQLRDQFGFERPFLKTDTQGYDVEVFRGAAGIHDQLAGVQSELALKRLYEDVMLWTDVIAEYSTAGFELAGIFPVNPTDRTLIECDCFFERLN